MTKFQMMKTLTGIVILLIACIFLGSQACNPDCSSATSQNISIDPSTSAVLAGRQNQVLLRAQPSNLLVNRKIFVDHPTKAAPSRLELRDKEFVQELNGVVVNVPDTFDAGMTPIIYVEDPDCSSEVIVANSLPIRDLDFFKFSDVFIAPPMPLVIIPTVPVPPPINITNAWITPYDRAYCIWFVPELDEQGNETSILRPLREDDEINFPNADPVRGSHEFVVCGRETEGVNADFNPVSGVVDKESGIINIVIDRTSKNLGVERFNGMFIEDDQIPQNSSWRSGGPCIEENGTEMFDFMLLTSEKTGQQILMIKAG